MSFATLHAAERLSRGLTAIALGLAAAACGGGGADTAAAPSETAAAEAHAAPAALATTVAAAPATVMVTGCVLDRFYLPTTGTPVRALAADGRLLGNAHSDAQGRFTLRLPARGEVMLQVDRQDGETLTLPVDAQAPTWDRCLLDETA